MFILRCPRCKQEMKYQGKTGFITGKRKVCVYCGHSFNVKESIVSRVNG